jgi:hypothetical protein
VTDAAADAAGAEGAGPEGLGPDDPEHAVTVRTTAMSIVERRRMVSLPPRLAETPERMPLYPRRMADVKAEREIDSALALDQSAERLFVIRNAAA